MKSAFVFIDDARFELDNFREHAAPAFARAEFIYAQTFAEAMEQLDGRRPLCFLLDIYGSLDPDQPGEIMTQNDLGAALGPAPDLSRLYQDLDQAPVGEAGNLFLRRVYAQVERWQRSFLAACEKMGQGRAYGLANLQAAREQHPQAAALGYSRKALYADAVALSQAGVDGLLQKPQGGDDELIAKATRAAAPDLAAACYAAVDRRLALLGGTLAARLCGEGASLILAEALEEGLRHLNGGLMGAPNQERADAYQALLELRLEDQGLAPAELALVLALREWLGQD